MPHYLQRILISLIAQAPLLGAWWLWWQQGGRVTIPAVGVSLVYELMILAATFFKDVWNLLKPDAVQFTADWVKAYIATGVSQYQRRYLQYITQSYGIFNVRGLGLYNTYTLHLDNVFVDLKIAPSSNPKRITNNPIERKELLDTRPIWDFLQSYGHYSQYNTALAIIGPPGCGKTTLLQHIALVLAGNRKRSYKIHGCIPILLFLRDHVVTVSQPQAPTLATLVQDSFLNESSSANLSPPPSWFEKKLCKGKCIVLLDGLDEVADQDKRKRVASWVDDQIKNYPNCIFIITARPMGYREAPLSRADVLEVQPFNAKQVRSFIENWYLANEIRASGNVDNLDVRQRATRDATDLLLRLRKASALSELTVNPLLLTMVAMVHRYHGSLPRSRIELYSEICQVLLGRWRQARGLEDRLNAAQKLVVLRPLAAYMMQRKLRDIPLSQALEVIRSPLEHVGILSMEAEHFLQEMQSSSGLVLEREAERWSFAHLTFQEYLTSIHWLAQDTIKQDWKILIRDNWWHETLRLYAAQGDTSKIIQTCLNANTVSSLTLAVECIDEARELDPKLRQRFFDNMTANFESDDNERHHLAAEVKLALRLKSLLQIDESREIDLEFLTCAEYQLFLDEMKASQRYFQPFHWKTYRFPNGEAQQPISGVGANDANVFCEWLSRKYGGNARFRLPSPQEARSYPANASSIVTWCHDENDSCLSELSTDLEQSIIQSLSLFAGHDLPFLRSVASIYNIENRLNLAPPLAESIKIDEDLAKEICHRFIPNSLTPSVGVERTLGLSSVDTAIAHHRFRALRKAHTNELNTIQTLIDSQAFSSLRSKHKLSSGIGVLDEMRVAEMIGGLPTDLNTSVSRAYKLLKHMLAVADARTSLAAQIARQECQLFILECVYFGFEQMKQKSEDKWWLRLFTVKGPDIESEQASILNLYWYLQVLMQRKAGRLRAWEGIRIVREQIHI